MGELKLVITPWVTHDGGAIYSLDMSPTEYKLVTCGNGDGGEGVILVWNLLPMLSEKHGRAVDSINPLLARIQQIRSVNTVRWSRCGKFFACGSDDKTVTVWEYGGRIKSAGTIGMRREEASQEKYRCVHTMHGHSMEVLSVEWSWDGRLLASASIDNTVVVWNALKLPERMVVLDAARDGHTGPVKGLSFDPIGKYLASQSADKTLRVWSVENWTCEEKISDPFEESAQSTMFLRPEWSPDGKILVAPCAMNNGGPTAQLVMRGSWDYTLDLVGHRRAVTVVRSTARIFDYEDCKGKLRKVSLFAVGSRDKSLSIWALPGQSRPLAVINNLFKHSIMDAAWKGTNLICCSQDGTVKTLLFDEGAVGRMLRLQEMSDLCYDLYRTRPSQYAGHGDCTENGVTNGSPTKSSSFIETPADLIASRLAEQPKNTEKEAREREREEAERRAKAEAELLEKRKEQVENRTRDGKRRIQPIFLCSTIDTSVPEKPDIPDDVMDVDKEPPAAVIKPTTMSVPKELEPSAAETTSGSSSETGSSSDGDSDDDGSSSSSGDDDDDVTDRDTMMLSENEEDGKKRSKKGKRGRRKEWTDRDRMLASDFRLPVLRTLERLEKDSLTLAAAELQRNVIVPIQMVKCAWLCANNEWSTSGVRATRLRRIRGADDGTRPIDIEGTDGDGERSSIWTAFLPTPVLIMAANSKYCVATCADCSLHVLSTTTGTVQFMLQLDSLPAQLGLQDGRTYVMTSNGYFSSWDIHHRSALFARIPVLDIVSKDVHLDSISLSPSGSPLISFSNGSSYSYSASLQSWYVVDASTALTRLCEGASGEDVGAGAVGRVIKSKKRPGVAPQTSLATRAWAGQGQMEGWLFAALDTHSFDDLRPMVARYTDMLIMHKSMDKLRELLDRLDDWVKRSEMKEKRSGDEWMDMEKMKMLRDMVRQSVRSDARVSSLLKEMEQEGQMIF